MSKLDVTALMALIDADGSSGQEKIASAGAETDAMEKVASELYAAGQILATGFADNIRKIASAGGLTSHAPGNGVDEAEASNWNTVAQKIQRERQGAGAKKKPESQMAESHYPNVARKLGKS